MAASILSFAALEFVFHEANNELAGLVVHGADVRVVFPVVGIVWIAGDEDAEEMASFCWGAAGEGSVELWVWAVGFDEVFAVLFL